MLSVVPRKQLWVCTASITTTCKTMPECYFHIFPFFHKVKTLFGDSFWIAKMGNNMSLVKAKWHKASQVALIAKNMPANAGD